MHLSLWWKKENPTQNSRRFSVCWLPISRFLDGDILLYFQPTAVFWYIDDNKTTSYVSHYKMFYPIHENVLFLTKTSLKTLLQNIIDLQCMIPVLEFGRLQAFRLQGNISNEYFKIKMTENSLESKASLGFSTLRQVRNDWRVRSKLNWMGLWKSWQMGGGV